MSDPVQYNSLSVHPSCINVYFQSTQGPRPRDPVHSTPPQFSNNATNGKISINATRKVTRAIDYLVYLAQDKRLPYTLHGKGLKFKLNFITLTLSSAQRHTDKQIKALLLHQFLIEMEKRWHVHTYIWRAEKQKNGSIHFHLVTTHFIPWNELRNVWNRIQQKLGYVTKYRENRQAWHRSGFHFDKSIEAKRSYEIQLKAYKEGLRTDWQSPNSTDVHSLKHVYNVKRYFIKYMVKSEQSVNTAGRLWGCSFNLSNIKGARADLYSSIEDELLNIENSGKFLVIHNKWYSVYFCTVEDLQQLSCFTLLTLFYKYISNTYPWHDPPDLFTKN